MLYKEYEYALRARKAFYTMCDLASDLLDPYHDFSGDEVEKQTAQLFQDPAELLRVLSENLPCFLEEGRGDDVSIILEGVAALIGRAPDTAEIVYDQLFTGDNDREKEKRSVCIKNMSIPHDCSKCGIAKNLWGGDRLGNYSCRCGLTNGKVTMMKTGMRPQWCPLVEIQIPQN